MAIQQMVAFLGQQPQLRAGDRVRQVRRHGDGNGLVTAALTASDMNAVIALRARHEAVAEQHLRQALLLDPADPANWRALAQFYRATGATKRLAALASEHQTLLSSPLPE